MRIQSAIMAAGSDSLPEFARGLGWSRALIYQYVSGRVLVQLDRLQQIADATGKPLEWFLSAEPNGERARAAELQGRLEQVQAEMATAQEALAAERGWRLGEEQRTRQSTVALLLELCRAQRRSGDAAALLETAARLLELARQADDPRAETTARTHLGHAWFLQGELPRAEESLRAALQTADPLPDPGAAAAIRQELLRVLLQSGHTAAARAEAVALAEADLWWPRWSGRVSLAAIAIQTGELTEAVAQLDAAEKIVRQADEPAARKLTAETYILSNRATLALAAGDYRRAGELSEALRSTAGRAGAMDQLREAELNLAVVALRRGEIGRATELLCLLAEWADLAGDARLRVLVTVFRSELARRCGHLKPAREWARAAVQEAVGLHQAQVLAEAELALGQAELEWDRVEDARDHLQRCVHAAADLQYTRVELQGRLGLSQLGAEDGVAGTDLRAEINRRGLADVRVEALLLQAQTLPAEAAEPLLAEAGERAHALAYFWPAHAALLQRARLCLDRDDAGGAEQFLQQAQALRRERAGREACPALTQAERTVSRRLPSASGPRRGSRSRSRNTQDVPE